MFGAGGLTYRHVDAPSTPVAEILGALEEARKAGKIRWIGLSNESPWGVMKFVSESERPACRACSRSRTPTASSTAPSRWASPKSRTADVGLLAYSPLAQGYLTGKYQNGALPEGARKTLFNRLQRYESAHTNAAIEKYLGLARETGLDPSQMAIKFCLTRPFVSSVIIGATTMAQLKTDIDAHDVVLSDDVLKKIDAIHASQPNPAP